MCGCGPVVKGVWSGNQKRVSVADCKGYSPRYRKAGRRWYCVKVWVVREVGSTTAGKVTNVNVQPSKRWQVGGGVVRYAAEEGKGRERPV